MVGININCSKVDYISLILDGLKHIETRDVMKNGKGSLDCYIGKRVGLIETGKGPAKLVGYATIEKRITYDSQESFDKHVYLHRIYPEDEHYYNGTRKFGYLLRNVNRCNPVVINTQGRVARKIK